MPRLALRVLYASLTLLLAAVPLPAQPAQPKDNNETVKFETVDDVTIKGTYWPSTKGRKAPVAILLHKTGERSNEQGMKDLARDLQKEDFAVLTFDFRGHGASTSVDQMFWEARKNPHNRQYLPTPKIVAGKLPDTISHTSFRPGYFPYLVNDIAAAKSFLDRRYNDNSDCNTANIVLIGVEDGATLGALWLASETKRHRMLPPVGMMNEKPESKDVIACVWLNIATTIGTKTPVNVSASLKNWLKDAGSSKETKIPMAFFFGKEDTAADAFNLSMVRNIRGQKYQRDAKVDPNDELRLTVDFGVPMTKLTGTKLLVDPLTTRDVVVNKYLKNYVLDEKKGLNEWEKRENEKSVYGWYAAIGRPPVYAKQLDAKLNNVVPLTLFGLR